MARLGIGNIENLDLKLLAQRVYDDRTHGNRQLALLARQEDIDPGVQRNPPLPIFELKTDSKEDFDRMYLRHVIDVNRDDIKRFSVASKTARNSDVRDYAAKWLPALREQQRFAQNINRMAGFEVDINEGAGAEAPGRAGEPFYQGDPESQNQFNQ